MEARMTQTEAVFRRPFRLKGMESTQPPGNYKISLVEEQLDTLSVVSWRQVAVSMQIARSDGTECVAVDPQELRAALERDRVISPHDAVILLPPRHPRT